MQAKPTLEKITTSHFQVLRTPPTYMPARSPVLFFEYKLAYSDLWVKIFFS